MTKKIMPLILTDLLDSKYILSEGLHIFFWLWLQDGFTFKIFGWNLSLICHHSNESYWAVLSCGTVYYAVQGGSFLESVYETLLSDHSDKSVPGRHSDWSAFDAGCSDKSSWTNKIYMVLFTMLRNVVHFMTIQVKAMKEYFDELNNYKY